MKTRALIMILSVMFLVRPVLADSSFVKSGITLKIIKKFIRDNPNDPNLYFVKGQILSEKNRLRKARRAFETTLELYPEYDEAYYELARANQGLRNHEEALMYIQKYLNEHRADIDAQLLKAEILVDLCDYEHALTTTDLVLKENGFRGKAYLLKGEASFQLGDYDTAQMNWRKALDLGEKEAGLHLKYLFKPVW